MASDTGSDDTGSPAPARADEVGLGAGGRARARGMVVYLPVAAFIIGGALGYEVAFVDNFGSPNAERSVSSARVTFALPKVVANLDAPASRPVFVRMQASLTVATAADIARLRAAEPQILDAVQAHLRALRPEDISGPAGLSRLREEIARRVTRAASGVDLSGVLIEELLVQ